MDKNLKRAIRKGLEVAVDYIDAEPVVRYMPPREVLYYHKEGLSYEEIRLLVKLKYQWNELPTHSS